MAQTGTTVITLDSPEGMSPRVLKLAWTSTAGGAVVTDTDSTGYSLLHGYGMLEAAIFACEATTTAAYDVTITDGRTFDILNGAGANLTGGGTTDTKRNGVASVVLGPVAGQLTLTISAAGASKTGTIYLYIR